MPERWSPRHRRAGWLLVTVGLVGLFAVARWTTLPGPPCLFNLLMDLPCPGCGATRAVRALARFDLASAVAMNPLATLTLFGLLGWMAVRAAQDFGVVPPPGGGGARRSKRLERTAPVWVGAMLLNWAYLIASGR